MEIEKANKNSETITIENSTEPYDKLHSFQREIEKKYVVIVNRKIYNSRQVIELAMKTNQKKRKLQPRKDESLDWILAIDFKE